MKYYFKYLSTITYHFAQKDKSQRRKLNKGSFQYSFLCSHYRTVEQGSASFLYIYITSNSFLLNLKREITNLKFNLLNSSMC